MAMMWCTAVVLLVVGGPVVAHAQGPPGGGGEGGDWEYPDRHVEFTALTRWFRGDFSTFQTSDKVVLVCPIDNDSENTPASLVSAAATLWVEYLWSYREPRGVVSPLDGVHVPANAMLVNDEGAANIGKTVDFFIDWANNHAPSFFALLGPQDEVQAESAASVLSPSHLMLCPSTTSSAPTHPNVFSIQPTHTRRVRRVLRSLVDMAQPVVKALVLHEGTAGAEMCDEVVRQFERLNVTATSVNLQEPLSQNTTAHILNFNATLQDDDRPVAVFCTQAFRACGHVLKGFYDAQVDFQAVLAPNCIVEGDTDGLLSSNAFVSSLGMWNVEWYETQLRNNPARVNTGNFSFAQGMRGRLGDDASVEQAATAFAAAQVLTQALEATLWWNDSSVLQTLADLEFDTVVGKVRFDESRRNQDAQLWLNQFNTTHMNTFSVTDLSGMVFPMPTWGNRHCEASLKCGEHGECDSAGDCTCDAGWGGDVCQEDLTSLDEGVFVAVVVTVVVFVAVIVAIGVAVWKHKNMKIIKASTPEVSLLILVGTAILLLSLIPLGVTHLDTAQATQDAACKVLPQLVCYGLTLIMGGIWVRNWRVYQVFSNPEMVAVKISTGWLITRLLCPPLSVVVAFMAAYCATEVKANTLRTGCSHNASSPLLAIALFPCGALVVLVIAYCALLKIQEVPDQFNDTRNLNIALYNITTLGAALLVLALIADDPNSIFISWSVAMLAGTVSFVAVLYGPKMYAVWVRAFHPERRFAAAKMSIASVWSAMGIPSGPSAPPASVELVGASELSRSKNKLRGALTAPESGVSDCQLDPS